MSKILFNSPELHGFSKSKIIWFTVVIAICIIGLILYGIFVGDGKTKNIKNSDVLPDKGYSNIDSMASINQVLQQVNDKHVASTNVLSMHSNPASKLISNLDQESMVPPIISTSDELQAQKQLRQTKQRFEQKQVENNYTSLSSKTLMFSRFLAKGDSSQPRTGSVVGKMDAAFEHKTLAVQNNESLVPQSVEYIDVGSDNGIDQAKSPYELKAGSVIPATMINGINSDLPGSVVAQVRENIYNSTTRQYLLIPQGAKLVGNYDSHIMYGQERLIVAWTRLIYPDGSSAKLHALPGSDLEGYSGFHDQVDNKYWRLFGASFIMGVITAGMQYSQNNTNNNVQSGGYATPTVGQTLSGSLGQQLGQTGLAVTQKNLNVQPTLTIRPNYQFNIMLTADLVLRPWTQPKAN